MAERIDAGVRPGETLAQGMIAEPIGPDMRMAVVGSPSDFATRPRPRKPQELAGHNCINLRLPIVNLYAWEFEKGGRQLKVRVEGQLVVNAASLILTSALASFGLGHLAEDNPISKTVG